jgi:hypothetical protein
VRSIGRVDPWLRRARDSRGKKERLDRGVKVQTAVTAMRIAGSPSTKIGTRAVVATATTMTTMKRKLGVVAVVGRNGADVPR